MKVPRAMNNIEFADWFKETEIDKAEALKLDIAYKLDQALIAQSTSRTELAKKIGTSPAWITKVLRGDINLTIETMVKLADALELDLNLNFSRRVQKRQSATIFDLADFKSGFRGAKEFKFTTSFADSICNDFEFENAA